MNSELKIIAESLEAISKALMRMAADQVVPEKAEPVATEEPKVEEKLPTIEEVRTVLTARSREGFTKDVKALLMKHGAGCLKDIAPCEYKALLEEAEALGNG